MSIRVFAVLSCVLLLGACAEKTGGGGAEGGGGGAQRQDTVLESLTPKRLCALLPDDTIEQTLDVVVTESKGRESGRPPILNKTCRYRLEFELADVEVLPPDVTTGVAQTRDKGVDELLDRAFTDLADESEQVKPYERVDGLGEGAGYGDNPFLESDLPESQLVVVFTAGGERFIFDVTVSPRTPLDQLTPLATELLAALEAELG